MTTPSAGNRFRVLCILTLALTLFPACEFATGVGDPAKSKVDKDLAGYWVDDTSNLHVLIATPRKDGKSYDFEWISGEGSLAAPTKITLAPLAGQAWLTEIGGGRFVTAKFEKVPKDAAAQAKEKPYVILKLQHSGDNVTLTKLNAKNEAFAQAKTPADLEAAIKAHLAEDASYEGMSTLKRTTAEATKKLREMAAEKTAAEKRE